MAEPIDTLPLEKPVAAEARDPRGVRAQPPEELAPLAMRRPPVACPGCAWPDPDGHRSITEFCENGAKAIAEEGTTREMGPEFFARHGVKELGLQVRRHHRRSGDGGCPLRPRAHPGSAARSPWRQSPDHERIVAPPGPAAGWSLRRRWPSTCVSARLMSFPS